MSQAKHHLDEMDRHDSVATSIAIKAGVLERCEHHEDVVFSGGNDIEEAYKLGNSMYSADELSNVFSSRREMTDAIQHVVESIFSDECPDCAKWDKE